MSASFDLDLALTFDFDSSLVDPTWNSPNISVDTLVAGLPRVSVTGGKCMICMEEFAGEEDEARQMPCCHTYHSNCISRWLYQYNSCPLCRSTVCKP
ncbi:RING-type E3 ubiquitin transferase [Ranunculus cassubicifolius]